jgi:hypothetical protein
MSETNPGDLDQRLLDGIRLTGDAYDAGQIVALERIRSLLENELASQTALDPDADRTEREAARGARHVIERVLRDIDWQIERVTLRRNR